MLCHCTAKHSLHEIDVKFGIVRKRYSCSNGHKRDVVRDRGLIEIIDYMDNYRNVKRIYTSEDDYQTDRLSGRKHS